MGFALAVTNCILALIFYELKVISNNIKKDWFIQSFILGGSMKFLTRKKKEKILNHLVSIKHAIDSNDFMTLLDAYDDILGIAYEIDNIRGVSQVFKKEME